MYVRIFNIEILLRYAEWLNRLKLTKSKVHGILEPCTILIVWRVFFVAAIKSIILILSFSFVPDKTKMDLWDGRMVIKIVKIQLIKCKKLH